MENYGPNSQDDFETFLLHSRHDFLHSVTVARGISPYSCRIPRKNIEVVFEIFCFLALAVVKLHAQREPELAAACRD